ncbi:hypothetical protein B0H14DRAFT_2790593 [Mycena olivaceomarginata]|nr:hypothetical protein B0H14DRAFT_2790593 [Mycena olivaceomarginata]
MRAAWLPFAMPTSAATEMSSLGGVVVFRDALTLVGPSSLLYSPFSEGPCALGFAVSRNGEEMHAPWRRRLHRARRIDLEVDKRGERRGGQWEGCDPARTLARVVYSGCM